MVAADLGLINGIAQKGDSVDASARSLKSRLALLEGRDLGERISIFEVPDHGGSGVIRGTGKEPGGHCTRGRRIRAPEKERLELYGAVPVPRGEDALVCRASSEADFPLLRVREGWRRF